jgi:hypothetical protein
MLFAALGLRQGLQRIQPGQRRQIVQQDGRVKLLADRQRGFTAKIFQLQPALDVAEGFFDGKRLAKSSPQFPLDRGR